MNKHHIPLINSLIEADAAYVAGTPLMEDPQYDALRAEAYLKFPNDPYFQTVGAPLCSDHLGKVKLGSHMGSQLKVNTDAEMEAWVSRYSHGSPMVASHKLDGNSVEIQYVDGKMVRAATRGDGEVGQDITANAMFWKGIPIRITTLVGTVFVRGEAMLGEATFVEHFPEDSNPRNTCSGIIQRGSDPSGDNQHIEFIAFNIEHSDPGIPTSDYLTSLAILKAIGFRTVSYEYVRDFVELKKFRDAVARIRKEKKLEFGIDGMVVCVNSLAVQRTLGFSPSGKHPLGQIAWKFENDGALTTLIGIAANVGHTGAIVPTGILEPVKVGGVEISRVTLNNWEFIKDMDLNIGDLVRIERANDVIPMLTSVSKKETPGPFTAPKICPVCSSTVTIRGRGRVLFCTNEQCLGRRISLVDNWIDKTGIEDIGDALLDALMTGHEGQSLVYDPADLYSLTPGQISGLAVGEGGRLGESAARRVVKSIQDSRVMPISTFMGSLGIQFLGRTMAAKIGFSDIEQWLSCTVEQMADRVGVGQTKAKAITEGIFRAKTVISRLTQHVEILRDARKVETKETEWTGKQFVFTGERLSTADKDIFDAVGCIEGSGVSKKTHILVQGDGGSATSKTKKALQLNIQIIQFGEFVTKLRSL